MTKKRILVVEDEAITSEQIKLILEEMGYEVSPLCFSGEEAVKRAGEENPDLVLMDIILGGEMDGIEAARQISSGYHIPIVYLSAHSDNRTLERARTADPSGFITKPFDESELRISVDIAIYKSELNKKLRESEEKYRTLFENATDSIFLVEPETGRIIDFNKMAARTTRYSPDQLRNMKITDLYPEEEQDVIKNIFRKVTERDSLSDISGINLARKNGKLVPAEINAATIKINGKKYCLSFIRDITKRKKAEDNLLAEKDKLVSIFNAMEDGVYITNQHFDIEYVNPAFKKEFGAIKGRKCHDYFHGRKKICPMCKHQEAFSGETTHWEWFSPKNKKTYDLIDAPLKNPDGSISKLSIFRDITDRKRIEKELEEASLTDELTGLFNRRGFFSTSERQWKLAERYKRDMSLIYLDIDNMKALNDEMGHKTGDQALIDAADVLRKTFRKSDIIARIGGDEFAVLLTEHSEPDIKNIIVNNIRENLKMHNKKAGRNYNLSLSIGLACYKAEAPCSIDELLTKADSLMYIDKKDDKTSGQSFYPTKERRIYKRLKPGKAINTELDGVGRISAKDISIGGICLKTTEPLITNKLYNIRIFSGKDIEITPSGTLAWSSQIKDSSKKKSNKSVYLSGISFMRMDDDMKSSLGKLVSQLNRV